MMLLWSFIELVAMSIVDGVDALEDDELYAIHRNKDLMSFSGPFV